MQQAWISCLQTSKQAGKLKASLRVQVSVGLLHVPVSLQVHVLFEPWYPVWNNNNPKKTRHNITQNWSNEMSKRDKPDTKMSMSSHRLYPYSREILRLVPLAQDKYPLKQHAIRNTKHRKVTNTTSMEERRKTKDAEKLSRKRHLKGSTHPAAQGWHKSKTTTRQQNKQQTRHAKWRKTADLSLNRSRFLLFLIIIIMIMSTRSLTSAGRSWFVPRSSCSTGPGTVRALVSCLKKNMPRQTKEETFKSQTIQPNRKKHKLQKFTNQTRKCACRAIGCTSTAAERASGWSNCSATSNTWTRIE
jgi:hypothetical protein